MATTKHTQYSSSTSILSTELNSLANNTNSSASAVIDNTTSRYLYHDITVSLAAQGSARSLNGSILLYIVTSENNITFDDVNEITAELISVFTFDNTTTARRSTRRDIPVPASYFKFFARNTTGQTLASSGNIISFRSHSVETL